MKWYYAEGGKQIGPVEESALDDLVRQGTVRDDTLVWREGMAAWQRHSAVRGPSPGSPPPPAPPPAPAIDLQPSYTQPSYSQPTYPQGSQAVGGARRFGGFWIRFLARLIDNLLLGIALCILIVPLAIMGGGLGFLAANRPESIDITTVGLPIVSIILLTILVPALYEIYFVSTRAATPGKLALGLKIIRADGAPITTGLAVGRFFAYLLTSLIPLAIGFIIAGFDREKRAVHDHICGTRVVYTR